MTMHRADEMNRTYGSVIKVNLTAIVMAMAVVWQVGVTAAYAQAPTVQLSRVVVPAGSTTVVTVTGTPGENFAVLGSSRGAGLAYAGVNFAVGTDFVLLSVGTLDGSGSAVVGVTPPFLGSELDRYYIQVATSPSPQFVPLQVAPGQVLLNGDLAPLASLLGAAPQGPVGPQGPQGTAGATGVAGSAGTTGATGAAGLQGAAGAAGAVGAAGALGPQGPQGPEGAMGAVGPAGADGAQGPAGMQGAAGANGADGAVGTQGPAGPVGPAGAQGPLGATGAVGAVGPQGSVGTNGTNGVDGASGAQGPAGANGANGTNGVDGAPGAQGAAGVNGVDGAAGSQGPAGAAGPAGAQGPSGVAGPAGPTGPQGLVGPSGAVGATGATGAQGAAGATGAQGPIGFTGATGAQGPVGPGADGWVNTTAAGQSFTTTEVTLATLNLPTGTYLLSAKASIQRTAGSQGTVCTLYNGATVLDQLTNQTSTIGELAVLEGSVTLATAGTITMRCNGQTSVTATASRRTLRAYKLNTLTVQ